MSQTESFDDRSESYLQIGDVAREIARRHCDVRVDDTTHERWRQLLALLREFDTLVDSQALPTEEAMGWLEYPQSPFIDRYPALFPKNMEEENFHRLLGRTRLILQLGQHASRSTSPDDFVSLRLDEGGETAWLLADAATGYVREQHNFETRFMPVMVSLGQTATLLDSITDARSDYRHGALSIEPDRHLYLKLFGAISAAAHPGIGAVAHRSILKEFGVMSVNRLRNRMRYGVSPYSSVNMIKGR